MPLKADNTITIAAVEIVIPTTEMDDIKFITFCDFFENKYRFAMKNEVFTNL